MELVIRVNCSEVMELPIEMLVAMTQSGWKTISCKRRINEFCDEVGWSMLDEAVKEAHVLYEASTYQSEFDFNVMSWNRIKELITWAANIVYYGTTGIKC